MEKRSKSRFERIHGIARIPRDSFQHYRSKEKKMTRRKKKKGRNAKCLHLTSNESDMDDKTEHYANGPYLIQSASQSVIH